MVLSEILTAAKWTQPSPPTTAAPYSAMPHGIRVTSSKSDPASSDAVILSVALDEVGIQNQWVQDPELRLFEYGFIFIGE
jgi:hypothetical protein